MGKRLLPTLITGMAFLNPVQLFCPQLHVSFFSLFYSISAVPAFPKLRRFPDGRDFSQWTGDDSKALMKVNLLGAAN